MSSESEDVNIIAMDLIKTVIDMGILFIKADPMRFFVYRDPLYDDIRPPRRTYDESKRSSRKASEASQISDQVPALEKDTKLKAELEKLTSRKRGSLKSQYFDATDAPIFHDDDDDDVYSKRYSYLMTDPGHRTSADSSTRRSTFEDVVFREKTKQVDQDELWNYAISESSLESEVSEDLPEIAEDEIIHLKNLVYEWKTIDEFKMSSTIHTIRDFVNLWRLAPTTKFSILQNVPVTEHCLGETHTVTVAFSKPNESCPNPLAVANVYFKINCSYVMPQYFPIMITYQFETYRTHYNLMGQRNMRSITFQDFFIDTILNSKLSFYTEMYEFTNGSIKEIPKKYSVEDEYELYKKQMKIDQKFMPKIEKRMKRKTDASIKTLSLNYEEQKDLLTLLSVTRTKHYSMLIEKEEPWKLGLYNPADIENVNLKMKESEDKLMEVPKKLSVREQRGLSVFGLPTQSKSMMDLSSIDE